MEKEFNEKKHNRMCAEFLGYINETPEVKDFDMYVHPVYGDRIELNLFRPFTEDWNWIMMVIEKMEKLSSKTIFEITMEGAFKISRYKIEFIFQPNADSLLHLKLVNLPQDDYKNPFCKHHIVQHFDFANKGKKSAVVQAIWLFLNWYNENKNK